VHIRRIWIIGTRYRLVPSSSASSSSLNQRELPKVLGRISRRSDPALQPRFRQLRCKRAGECELQPNGFQSEPKAPPLSHKEEHDEEAVIDASPPPRRAREIVGPQAGRVGPTSPPHQWCPARGGGEDKLNLELIWSIGVPAKLMRINGGSMQRPARLPQTQHGMR